MLPQIKTVIYAIDGCNINGYNQYSMDDCKIWVQDLVSGLSETAAEEEKRQICLAAGCLEGDDPSEGDYIDHYLFRSLR